MHGFLWYQPGRTMRDEEVNIFPSWPISSTMHDVEGCQHQFYYELGGQHRHFQVYNMTS